MANKQTKRMAAIEATNDIEIELATRPALRLWQGREKTPKRHGILGVPGFCSFVRGIEDAIKADDPYADYHYHQIEKAIDELKFELETEFKDIDAYVSENTPSAMRLPSVSSKNPVVVPIRFASRLGFQLVYQLLQVDQIVLKILLANHIGLLENNEKFEQIARAERRVRSVIHTVFHFKHTGVTRDDMAANNHKATKAISEMGELESGYLDGSLRSANAPQLPARRVRTLDPKESDSPNNSNAEDLASHLVEVFAAEENPVSKPSKTKKATDLGVIGNPAIA